MVQIHPLSSATYTTMTPETFWLGMGVATAIYTTGFLLTLGAWAGIKAASWLFGPMNVNIGTTRVYVSHGDGRTE